MSDHLMTSALCNVTMVTGECQWLDLPLIKTVLTGCRSLFPVVRYAFTTIPTYPSGQIGFVLASLNKVRYVCVGVWVCGCVGAWVRGCVGVCIIVCM